MRIGIEHEMFIRTFRGRPTVREVARLATEGVASGGKSSSRHGVLFCLATGLGDVDVKIDAYTHVLEVVFPPAILDDIWVDTFEEVKATLTGLLLRLGMSILDGAAQFPLDEDSIIPFAATDCQSERLAAIIARRLPVQRFAIQHVHAAVCATQLHLEIDPHRFLPGLARAYHFQYLIPYGFTNSSTSGIHSLRPMILHDSFDLTEWYYGFPGRLIQSISGHRDFFNLHSNRDYAYIALHKQGTFEFRVGDSQRTGAQIAQMSALQMCIASEALDVRGDDEMFRIARSTFFRVCRDGDLNQKKLCTDLDALESRTCMLPDEAARFATEAIQRMRDKRTHGVS